MGTKGDRFELMRLFVRIAEARSLSAAGRLLGLSQPSTSRQLKQLESMLGVQLVQRSSAEFVLTDAGTQFLSAATDILADWDAAAEAVRLRRDELRGPIRVAAPVATGQTILAKIAARFLIEQPAVSFDWRLIDEPGDLAAGGYDLWIRAGPIRDQSLIVRDLWRAERAVVAHAAHPRVQHPIELEPYNAVQLVTYVSREIPLETADRQTMTLMVKPSFTTDNIYAALVAVREGVGYGILPYWAVQADLDSGAIIELCPLWRPPAVTLSVAYLQARFRPARVKIFLEYLRSELLRTGADVLPTGSGVSLDKPRKRAL
jgi:DNA-binding transcriptional LysR family regulator